MQILDESYSRFINCSYWGCLMSQDNELSLPNHGWQVNCGDCRTALQELSPEAVDLVVTDPPYGLSGEPKLHEMLSAWMNGDEYRHSSSKGFCGAEWDKFVPGPNYWKAVFRVMKPGAHLFCFAGTRTWDLMSLGIRLAGFESRNTIACQIGPSALCWMYGQGMGRSQMLKPAFEPILVFRKPLTKGLSQTAQMEATGTGNLHFDQVKMPRDENDVSGWHKTGAKGSGGYLGTSTFRIRDMSAEEIRARCKDARAAPNALLVGDEMEAALNGMMKGAARFFPAFYCPKPSRFEKEAGCEEAGLPLKVLKRMNDGGLSNEARWAPIEVRNNHQTVKPIKLLEWLIRLGSLPGQVVLDPFGGSMSTGCAAVRQRRRFYGSDLDPGFCDIGRARLTYWETRPNEELFLSPPSVEEEEGLDLQSQFFDPAEFTQ